PDAEGTIASRLATTPTEPGIAYAANNHGVFRTGDRGQTWQALDIPWPQRAFTRGVEALVCLPG
ncbi:MAG: glycosyl hydrolase, partial [bacterium]